MKYWEFLEKSHCELPDLEISLEAETREDAIKQIQDQIGTEIPITANNLVEVDKDGHNIKEEHE